MALEFDLNGVKDWRELYDEDKLRYPYESLIFYMMVVNLGEITKKNSAEVFHRLTVIQAVDGPLVKDRDVDGWFRQAHVERLIGLKTNVFPNMSRARFERVMGRAALLTLATRHRLVMEAENG